MRLLLCILCFTAHLAYASDPPLSVHSRYTSVRLTPHAGQQDLLTQTFEGTLPAQVHTIAQAIDYLLQPSGYQRTAVDPNAIALMAFLNQSLPLAHRRLGPLRLRDALALLVGSAWAIHVEPRTRRITVLDPQTTSGDTP